MNSISAKCGHVTRCLNKNEPLSEKVLEFAIGIIDENLKKGFDSELLGTISSKLTNGELLDDYESHIMLDVILLHKKLESTNYV